MSFFYTEPLIGAKVLVQNFGVLIFFILSGYLIFTTATRSVDFRSFFIGRFARIYVTYLPCLMIIAALDFSVSQDVNYSYADAFNLQTLIGNVLMLQDYPFFNIFKRVGFQWEITSFASGRPLWTLSVEWWLYMFFGWLYLRVIGRLDFSCRAILILALLGIVPIAHATFARGEGLTLVWLLGAGIAAFSSRLPNLPIHRWLALLTLFIIFFMLRFAHTHQFYDMQGAIFIAAAMAALIGLARSTRFMTDLPRPVILIVRYLAGMSFALYALHYSVIEFVRAWDIGLWQSLVASVVFSHVLALIVYFIFDRNHKKVAHVIALGVNFVFDRNHKRLAQVLDYTGRKGANE